MTTNETGTSSPAGGRQPGYTGISRPEKLALIITFSVIGAVLLLSFICWLRKRCQIQRRRKRREKLFNSTNKRPAAQNESENRASCVTRPQENGKSTKLEAVSVSSEQQSVSQSAAVLQQSQLDGQCGLTEPLLSSPSRSPDHSAADTDRDCDDMDTASQGTLKASDEVVPSVKINICKTLSGMSSEAPSHAPDYYDRTCPTPFPSATVTSGLTQSQSSLDQPNYGYSSYGYSNAAYGYDPAVTYDPHQAGRWPYVDDSEAEQIHEDHLKVLCQALRNSREDLRFDDGDYSDSPATSSGMTSPVGHKRLPPQTDACRRRKVVMERFGQHVSVDVVDVEDAASLDQPHQEDTVLETSDTHPLTNCSTSKGRIGRLRRQARCASLPLDLSRLVTDVKAPVINAWKSSSSSTSSSSRRRRRSASPNVCLKFSPLLVDMDDVIIPTTEVTLV